MTTSLHNLQIGNGETLCYRKAGSGEKVLLLIHGNMSSSIHWQPLLEALPPAFTAYAVDMRGFGDSSYHTPIDSLTDFAGDMVLFAQKLGLKRFTAIGWSTGGGVAMQLAAAHPGLVEKLVLVESMSYRGFPIFRKDARGLLLNGQYYSNKEELAADPVQVAPVVAALKEGNRDFMKFLWDQLIYVVKKPAAEEYRSYLAASMQQRNLVDVDWALTCFNLSHTHNGVAAGSGLVDQINCPVLSFWGDRDLVVTREMVEETAAAIGDNARLVILENCGHAPPTDARDLLLAEITAFVG
jgi:2-hydroxy-6-oxonona-2,4-dienedioate hydrolase